MMHQHAASLLSPTARRLARAGAAATTPRAAHAVPTCPYAVPGRHQAQGTNMSSAAGPPVAGPGSPPGTLAGRAADIQPTWSDVQVADVVRVFLHTSPEEQTHQVRQLHHAERGRVDAVLAAVVRGSPLALEFLARVRAICAAATRDSSADLGMVDDALTGLLRTLYAPALLQLHQLSAARSASVAVAALTHAARMSEVVHKADSDAAFARKFGARRVVHALSHCAQPSRLLAVLYSAFLPRIPASMADLDAWSGGAGSLTDGQRAPGAGGAPAATVAAAAREEMHAVGGRDDVAGLGEANTVAFYSVSSSPDMRGLRLGRRVIYDVASLVADACPAIRTFVTLSPVPGFTAWLRSSEGAQAVGAALTADDRGRIRRACAAAGQQGAEAAELTGTAEGAAVALARVVADAQWHASTEASTTLQPVLMAACHRYLTTPAGSRGEPLCSVAGFHLANGARMARLCWGADASPAGLARSAGIMVNYLYSEDGSLSEAMRVRALAYDAAPGRVLASQAPEWVGVVPGVASPSAVALGGAR
jgi:hypothetical protein